MEDLQRKSKTSSRVKIVGLAASGYILLALMLIISFWAFINSLLMNK